MILRFFQIIDRVFAWLIEMLLVLMLLAMVGITFSQVILRNFFHSGISWAEIGARHSVLWITFLGAMIATRSRQHLSIDAVTKLLPDRARYGLHIALDLFAAIICGMLTKAAYVFVMEEYAMGETLFLNIKSWIIQSIIPFGFAMISLEYAIGVVVDIFSVVNPMIPNKFKFWGEK